MERSADTEKPSIHHVMEDFIRRYEHASLPHAAFYAIDYSQRQYLLVSQSCGLVMGYRREEMIEGGLGLLLDIYQRDDFRVYNQKVFPVNMQLLRAALPEERQNMIFNYNFRVVGKDGALTAVCQRGQYLTTPEGLPVYSYGLLQHQAERASIHTVRHSVERWGGIGDVFMNEVLHRQLYFPYEEDRMLTQREREVLKWICEGFSSKQIAAKLHIAENTVVNHRKSMLQKTGTLNVAQLVAFAVRNGIV
ncbi:response regulator transcription factor [Chitinophaga lutea]